MYSPCDTYGYTESTYHLRIKPSSDVNNIQLGSESGKFSSLNQI